MSFTDYYKILGVPPDASEDEIKGAYRHLAKFYHPDVNKAPEAVKHFIEVQTAYDTLIDPIQRKEYDDKNRKEFTRDFQGTSAPVPVEHRPGQNSPQVSNPFPSMSGAMSDQAPTPLDDSPYEETRVPYFPQPSERPPQPTQRRNSVPVADLPAADPPPSPPRQGIPETWTHFLTDLAKTRVTITFPNRWTTMGYFRRHPEFGVMAKSEKALKSVQTWLPDFSALYRSTKFGMASFFRQLNQLYRLLNQGQRAFLVQWIGKVDVKQVLAGFVLTPLAGLASFFTVYFMAEGLYYLFHLQPSVDFIRIILFILRLLIKVSVR